MPRSPSLPNGPLKKEKEKKYHKSTRPVPGSTLSHLSRQLSVFLPQYPKGPPPWSVSSSLTLKQCRLLVQPFVEGRSLVMPHSPATNLVILSTLSSLCSISVGVSADLDLPMSPKIWWYGSLNPCLPVSVSCFSNFSGQRLTSAPQGTRSSFKRY